MSAASHTDLARISQAADDTIVAIGMSLCSGDELFSSLTREIGYGQADQRLRTFLHRVQRHIERQK